MKNADSYIDTNKTGATAFVGPDAHELYRVTHLRTALKLLSVGIQPVRGFTMKKALALATKYTGQTYKRNEWLRAREDLKVWMSLMLSALPVVRK